MAAPGLSLSVNGSDIPLHPFAREYIGRVVSGILAALKESDETKNVNLSISRDSVTISLDNNPVPTNPFVNRITKNTIIGMVSSLRGVSEIESLEISITR